MNIVSRFLIALGLKLTPKINKWKWVAEVAQEVNKEMTERAIELGKDIVEVEKMRAMLRYINSLQERLDK